jgi:hypothetical protein
MSIYKIMMSIDKDNQKKLYSQPTFYLAQIDACKFHSLRYFTIWYNRTPKSHSIIKLFELFRISSFVYGSFFS